jgi:hypothetical protein
MKAFPILALLFYVTTLCHADALENLKIAAASDGFTYKGIEHMSAAYYRFANGPREVWIPVRIKDDVSEISLVWTAAEMSASWTWSMTKAGMKEGNP